MASRPPPHAPDRDSSTRPAADDLYRIGLHRLLAGQPDATGPLSQVVGLEPNLAIAHIALGCALELDGHANLAAASGKAARACLTGASRRDRQRVEILGALIEGKAAHAIDLAFEHLAEFGVDLLVVHQLAWYAHHNEDPGRAISLRALADQLPHASSDSIELAVLAWIDAVTGHRLRARALAERALRADPDNATAAHALALASA